MNRRKSSRGRVFNYPSSLPNLSVEGSIKPVNDNNEGDEKIAVQQVVANANTTWNKNITNIINNPSNYSQKEVFEAIQFISNIYPLADKIITREGVSASEQGIKYVDKDPSTGLPKLKYGGKVKPKDNSKNNNPLNFDWADKPTSTNVVPLKPEVIPTYGDYYIPEVTVNANKYSSYNSLNAQEKLLLKSTDKSNPIHRALVMKANGKQAGNYADETKQAFSTLLTEPLAYLQTPQSLMIEGIEQARGKDYSYKNALPTSITGTADNKQRVPSQTFLENAPLPLQIAGDILIDPALVMGAANLTRKGIQKVGQIGVRSFTKSFIPDLSDVGSQLANKSVRPTTSIITPSSWQLQELPGLHLQSTMEGQAISKIVEPKTGLVNVEQALGIIGKESGGADKVALIIQGLGENIPKKMDYNEFRKTIQDLLIPLNQITSNHRSSYGIDDLGYYPPAKKTDSHLDRFGHFMRTPIDKVFKKPELLENQTLIFGNSKKFGKGSSQHGNPDATLGHAHFFRDAETPDVLTVTQIQSDAFQGTHRTMSKDINEAATKLTKLKEEVKDVYDIFGDKAHKFKDVLDNANRKLILEEAHFKNFTQKQLLDKNHQERYLQEIVDYAGKRGDLNKVRVPTSETAAKVQGYKPTSYDAGKTFFQGNKDDVIPKYLPEHQTILKKYSEQPKAIKKLFGEEPKIVTDSKGNTWYEFDIPKKFKEGKGEIKAFGLLGAGATGAAMQQSTNNTQSQKYSNGGQIVIDKATKLPKLKYGV